MHGSPVKVGMWHRIKSMSGCWKTADEIYGNAHTAAMGLGWRRETLNFPQGPAFALHCLNGWLSR
ncbi:hypothetical protein AGR4A_Lc40653 [Agrobacterium tumefaciens str. B6]|uniref:Uncharacterized protein n=1 Tax=Agrobacterium tumefaciens str. B6 TaxID=1183423 RepID=A0A822V3I3_AGRTU|nr:hypothetical protein AGR4A_Lc40653 [Agrobacterium tumefaciens str. B6]